jgi:hypothetical protein
VPTIQQSTEYGRSTVASLEYVGTLWEAIALSLAQPFARSAVRRASFRSVARPGGKAQIPRSHRAGDRQTYSPIPIGPPKPTHMPLK